MPISDRELSRSSYDPRPRFSRSAPALTLFLLLVIDLVVVRIFWRELNPDLKVFLKWYQFIVEHGRVTALGMNFSDYSPPYLYLLSLGTLANRLRIQPETIIRGIAIVGVLVAAVPVWWFAKACGWSSERSLLLALAFIALPEMVVNSFVWGQCDSIYTLFLIAFVYLAMNERGIAAASMLGIAFAFKMQTIFIAPFVLYLLLAGLLRWRHLLMAPLNYVLMMIPSALSGRLWGPMLTTYTRQAAEFKMEVLNAPNPYWLFQIFLPGSLHTIFRVGLILAGLVSLALIGAFLRRGSTASPEGFVLMATLSLAVMPYVLPEMHERYFFSAGAMAFLLAVARPRTWPIVVLIQSANLCAYTRFLLDLSPYWLFCGTILMTIAVVCLLQELFSGGRSPSPESSAVHRRRPKPETLPEMTCRP